MNGERFAGKAVLVPGSAQPFDSPGSLRISPHRPMVFI
jgi:hypothetical protein